MPGLPWKHTATSSIKLQSLVCVINESTWSNLAWATGSFSWGLSLIFQIWFIPTDATQKLFDAIWTDCLSCYFRSLCCSPVNMLPSQKQTSFFETVFHQALTDDILLLLEQESGSCSKQWNECAKHWWDSSKFSSISHQMYNKSVYMPYLCSLCS